MSEPVKHRRKLNTEQLEVLELLYKFRFGTNDLLAQYFGKKDRSFVYKRMAILLEQGLIGKRFEPNYRLQGKPAAYYLTPEGARKLQVLGNIDLNVRAIYKDKTVSEQFVSSSLELFAIYNQLKAQYGSGLKFFTKATMNHEQYDYFPHPLPDAYIRLDDKHFFLNVFYDNEPHFVAQRKIKQYIKYDEDGDWAVTETSLPTLLIVCESSRLAKRVQKYIAKASDDMWPDSEVMYAFTTRDGLFSNDLAVWQQADEPEEKLTLEDIS